MVTFCESNVRFDWCRTNRIDSVCWVTCISLCTKDGSVVTLGRREGETSSRRVDPVCGGPNCASIAPPLPQC